MFFGFKKYNGKRYFCLVRSYRKPGSKYPTNETVKRFCKEDEMSPELKKVLADQKAKKDLVNKISVFSENEMPDFLSKYLNAPFKIELAPVVIPEVQTNFNKMPRLFYGHLAFKKIWDQEFKLRYKIDYLQQKNKEITSWKLNDLLFYLVARKVLDPKSYFNAYSDKGEFLYCPWENIKQDNFYRGLDFMYENREEILAHAVRHHLDYNKQEVKVVFFDCTNTWFETPYDDLTWKIIRFRREVENRLKKVGLSKEQIDEYFESTEFDEELKKELDLTSEDILRMRGNSKEGRFAQPLVTVALAIDQTGFPIDCKVFTGNLSELKTVEPMIQSLKDKYQATNIYFTADRGLNSAESLNHILNQGLGFVVAQKVRNQKTEFKDQMLDLQGYRRFIFNEDKFIPDDTEPADKNCSRFKVCDYTRKVYVPAGDGTLTKKGKLKRKLVELKCKIVFTYTPERQKRDLAELENEVKRARLAVSKGELMGNPYSSGWRSLIATEKEISKDKKSKEQYRAIDLKQDVINERKSIAGYCAIVFNHPRDISQEDQLTDEQVLSTYHSLVKIEDCFKIMKSHFSIRPVYLWKKERIIAHCYICVLALMILKNIQTKLVKAGVNLSISRICNALKNASLGVIGDGTFKKIKFYNIGLSENIYTPELTGKGRQQASFDETEELEELASKYIQMRNSLPDDLDLILNAVGLKPLKIENTMGDLKRNLSLQPVPNTNMVSNIKLSYLAQTAQM